MLPSIILLKEKLMRIVMAISDLLDILHTSLARVFLPKQDDPVEFETYTNRFETTLRTLSDFYRGEFVFVLTDIADSTYLWNNYTAFMSDIIKIHHRIGTILIYENNGYEIKKEGDSYFAVFENLESARNFAIFFMNEIDRRCNKFGPSVKVRIGIDKGECFVVRDGESLRFYGDGPNGANRLCSSCEPGEISIYGERILKFED